MINTTIYIFSLGLLIILFFIKESKRIKINKLKRKINDINNLKLQPIRVENENLKKSKINNNQPMN